MLFRHAAQRPQRVLQAFHERGSINIGEDKRMPDGRAKLGAGFGGIEAVKSLSRAPVEVSEPKTVP